jgi:hypothetical protein
LLFLSCYTDASFGSVSEDSASVGGYVCLVGGGAVSWRSKKQKEVSQSTTESEYMANYHGIKEVVWMRRLLAEKGQPQTEQTPVYSDSEGAIGLAKNPILHGLTKHMKTKWH